MKNFTRLLMAVVLFVSYSCVQDTTEDLAPVISESGSGSGEVKTLQVTLPNPSRTTLGEKVDGKYPVYWSEGDVLSVNGRQTSGISISENNKSVAIFDMPSSVSVPYHIVYPYPGEDVVADANSGKFPVVFPTNQDYTEGTFAQGAAPMYAWSNGFNDVTMHHLTTVLRFSIKAKAGESVRLKYISVSTLNSEPISGIFDVYCGSADENDEQTGSVTSRDSAISTIFCNFKDEEQQLTEFELQSDKESVFYITVPHGKYSGFEVNFVDSDGFMCVKTFAADGEQTLLPGKVREFESIEFERSSKMLLIGSDSDMKTFAEMVDNGDFDANDPDKYDGAVLINDIDMSNVDNWSSINNFNCVFEGRDYTIRGLKLPLFGNDVKATISNLNVEAHIEESEYGKVGVIARSLAVGGKIFNCSAEGSIKYNNQTLELTEEPDVLNIGGVVGSVYGGNVSNSESFVEIKVLNSAKTGETRPYKPCVGGVVGYACAAVDGTLPVVVNNNSRGNVVWDDESNATAVIPFIGGVAGYVAAGTFTDNINSGTLSIETVMDDLDWGGVIGVSNVLLKNCENKGSMTINEQITTANIGGVVGKLEAHSISNCNNSGNLNFLEGFKIESSCNIGGVVALAEYGTESISDCDNYGTVKYLGACRYTSESETQNNANIRIGGVVGLAYTKVISNCTNAEGSDLYISGKLAGVNDSNNPHRLSAVSGVVGTHCCSDADAKIENCSNAGAMKLDFQFCANAPIAMSACVGCLATPYIYNCDNNPTGKMEIEINGAGGTANVLTSRRQFELSAIVGSVANNIEIEECDNHGTITYDKASVYQMYIGGIISGSSKTNFNVAITKCTNNGEIKTGTDTNVSNLYLGGILPNATRFNSVIISDCSNSKSIICQGQVLDNAYIGGIYGNANLTNDEKEVNKGNENTGRIVFAENAVANNLYMGGYCGKYADGYHNVLFDNAGTIDNGVSIECAGTVIENAYIGGFAGMAIFSYNDGWSSVNHIEKNDFKAANSGNIYVAEKAIFKNLYVGGSCGYATTSCIGEVSPNTSNYAGSIKNLTNSGTIEVAMPSVNDETQYPTNVYMGGVVGYVNVYSATSNETGTMKESKKLLKDCDNSGDIIYNGIALDGAYIGGVAGKAYQTCIKDCNNYGKITSAGWAGNSPGSVALATERGYARYKLQLVTHDFAIGGVAGEVDRDVENCSNSGAIHQECVMNPLKTDVRGGNVGSRFDIGGVIGRVYTENAVKAQHVVNLLTLTNTGEITIDGEYPYCTTNSTSMGESSSKIQSNDIDDGDRTNLRIFYRMNLAGVVGRLHDHSVYNVKYQLNGCTNEGAITTGSRSTSLKNFSIAGVAADIVASHVEFNGAINRGKITLSAIGEGTAVNTTTYHRAYFINIGGIAAQYIDNRLYTNKLLTGNIYNKTLTFNGCQNYGDISYHEVAASNYKTAAGILGTALHRLAVYDTGSDKHITSPSDLTLRFEGCVNSGSIEHISSGLALKLSHQTVDSSIAGGIAGNIGGACRDSWYQRFTAIDLIVDGCTNTAEASLQFERNNGNYSPNTAYNTSMVGGLIGCYVGGIGCADVTYTVSKDLYMRGTKDNPYYYSARITNSTNNGRVYGFSGVMGGIIGFGRWFVTIDNVTNNGEVVVATKGANGDSPYRNVYGDKKIILAGGIAGMLVEYLTTNRHFQDYASSNEGHLPYKLGSQSVNVRNSINTGNVGATDYAGGIVGQYRSARHASEVITGSPGNGGVIENCTNTGNIYSLDGMTTKVGAIVGSARMFSFAVYSHDNVKKTDESDAVLERPWHVGVRNCKIGGKVLRGANILNVVDKTNFHNCIYGEAWLPEYESIIEGKKYDGCTLYEAANDAETTTLRR